MAEKDIQTKKLEDYTEVFADIYNVLLFQQPLIDSARLKDGPTESIYKLDTDKDMEQRRDTLKEYMDSMHLILATFGIENQTKLDKFMPARVMSYDAGTYKMQVKSPQKVGNRHKLYPVITIVLNFSDQRWDTAKSLHEMLDIPNEFGKYVQDYQIQVFDVAYLDDEIIDSFTSDFKVVARFFKNKRLGNDIYDETKIIHDQEILELMAAFTNDKSYTDVIPYVKLRKKEGEAISMCTVAKGLINEGRAEGRAEIIANFLCNGGSEADAKRVLKATDAKVERAKELLVLS